MLPFLNSSFYQDIQSKEQFLEIPTPIFNRGGRYKNEEQERMDRYEYTDNQGRYWRSYPHNQNYWVSEDGLIWSKDRGRILKGSKNSHGSRSIIMRYCSKSIGRMVLETFMGPKPDNGYVHRLNGDKEDNRLENLEWRDLPTYIRSHKEYVLHNHD